MRSIKSEEPSPPKDHDGDTSAEIQAQDQEGHKRAPKEPEQVVTGAHNPAG